RHTRSYGDWSSDVCSSDLTDAVHIEADLEPQQEREDRQGTEDRPRYDVAEEGRDRRVQLPTGLYEDESRVEHVGNRRSQGNPGEIGRASGREGEDEGGGGV